MIEELDPELVRALLHDDALDEQQVLQALQDGLLPALAVAALFAAPVVITSPPSAMFPALVLIVTAPDTAPPLAAAVVVTSLPEALVMLPAPAVVIVTAPPLVVMPVVSIDGKPVEAGKTYKVAGWAPVAEEASKAGNKPVWDVVETWLKSQGGRVKPRTINTPKLIGVKGNPGMLA